MLQCRACNTPIEVFQRRYSTQSRDTHRIYIQCNGAETEICRIVMRCLSFEDRLTEDGDCTFSCGIQTYLILAHEDGTFYVKRWWNKPKIPREPMEIPIQKTIRQTTTRGRDKQTLKTQRNATHKSQSSIEASRHVMPEESHDLTHQETDFQAITQGLPADLKILSYLQKHKQATTAELRETFNLYPETFNKAIKKLIKAKSVEKVKRGVYQLIQPLSP